jgi:hypothetical protein
VADVSKGYLDSKRTMALLKKQISTGFRSNSQIVAKQVLTFRKLPPRSKRIGSRPQRLLAWFIQGLIPICVAGCVIQAPLSGGEVLDGNRDETVTSPLGKTSGEPNGTFADGIVAVFDSGGVARLQGTVSHSSDLDVFILGPLSTGDRLIIDASTPGSSLDTNVAVFDVAERLVFVNDDRSPGTVAGLDSFIDFIIRHDSTRYYLVMGSSPFAASSRRTGSYRIDVQVIRDASAVPQPVGQILLLNFEGGEVNSPALGPMTLPPLDAGDIASIYAGQTEALKEGIRASTEQNFERFNVVVVTTDDPPLPSNVKFTTIHIGGFNATVFGIADQVDFYNADFCDDGIIFAESFSPNIFSHTPTIAELAIAIGNITAHEAGHLLGLNHVSDDLDLMDDQSHADAFLDDQEFMVSPLSRDIMSLGFQDGPMLLFQTVGPSPAP